MTVYVHVEGCRLAPHLGQSCLQAEQNHRPKTPGPPPSAHVGEVKVLALPGVVHLLRAIRDKRSGEVTIEAWSPAVASGRSANCCLSDQDRRRLAAFLLEGLTE